MLTSYKQIITLKWPEVFKWSHSVWHKKETEVTYLVFGDILGTGDQCF